MIIELNLKKHCIQTELKKIYNKKISQYFKIPCEELEIEIETLKTLLESLDFSFLRSRFKQLRGGYEGHVYLEIKDTYVAIKEDGEVIVEFYDLLKSKHMDKNSPVKYTIAPE